MIVLKMSAQPNPFCGNFQRDQEQKTRKNGAYSAVLFPPKAEVVSSNLAGRAMISIS
jgi:hypothetical protein